MATKSKNFKHSLFFKTFCFLLSVIFFALSAVSLLVCAYFSDFSSDFTQLFSTEKLPAYRNSDSFNDLVFKYANNAAHMTLDYTDKQIEEMLLSEKDDQIELLVNEFLDRKAEIIRSELYYVATNYEPQYKDDFYYNAYNDLITETSTTTTTAPSRYTENEDVTEFYDASEEEVTTAFSSAPEEEVTTAFSGIAVDPFAPYNVRYCQQLLNTASGRDFLKYENLVREEALDVNHRFYITPKAFSYYASGYGMSRSYKDSEEAIRKELNELYNTMVENTVSWYADDMAEYKDALKSVKNFKYLLIKGEKTYSNIPENDRTLEHITDHDSYGIYKDGKLTVSGLSSNQFYTTAYLKDKDFGDYTLYFYIEDALLQSDDFYNKMLVYELYGDLPPVAAVIAGVIFLILAVLFFVILMNLCGHKNGCDETVTAFIDKLPFDIHFIITAALCVAIGIGWIFASDSTWRDSLSNPNITILLISLTAAAAAAEWALVVEWFTSFARLVKCNKLNSFIVKMFKLIFGLFGKIFSVIKRAFMLIFRKNISLSKFSTIIIISYFLINTVLGFALKFSLGWLFLLIPFNLAALAVLLIYASYLDKIIASSSDPENPLPSSSKMPGALKTLAENIEKTNDNLQEAVEQTLKNERMKTDLITNVSHDLRTPLTAIISYVGLLEKCDISDPVAKEHLLVLKEKSEKLKILINDLIEASKVSSGNVTLDISELNLSELVVQAVVEATPEFEKCNLDIRQEDGETPITVFADSSKTYRIIENLLSNARKYSAENSRVYIAVSENEDYGIFEIKNISKEPLNIDANELMERFVRGDKSRSRDGNGLGLSIARDLSEVQNGRLSITIDGDLFKASVYLPKNNAN